MLPSFVIRVVMTGLAGVSLFTGTAYAQSTPKVITAGNLTTVPPYAYKDPKTGEFTGFDRELFEAMAKKLGATVKWEFYSFTDLTSFAPLKTGRVDVYGGGGLVGHPQRRAQGVSFVDYLYEPYVFYTLKENAAKVKTPEALCGKKVATFRGSSGTYALVNKWNDEVCIKSGKPALVQVDIDGGTPTAKLELKQGRVDFAIGGGGAISYMNQSEGEPYAIVPRRLDKNMLGMAFLNEKKELGESLMNALNDLIADGTYLQLVKKWNLPVEDSLIGKATINNAPQPGK